VALAFIDNRIICYRSPFCGKNIYYGTRFVSDKLIQVARQENKKHLSTEYLFNYTLDIRSWQYDGPISPIQGVYRLPSSSTLEVDDQRATAQTNHFTPLSSVHIPTQTYREAGQIILENLQRTIKEDLLFLGSRIPFCELSGGLDSSFTAALVARERPGTKAYCFSFPDQPSHQFSIKCAKEVAAKSGIPLDIIDGNEIKVPDLTNIVPLSEEPVDFFWQGAIFGPVIQNLCGQNSAVFTGFGADQILNRTNSAVISLLQTGQFRLFYSSIRDLARSIDRSTLNLVWQAFIAALPPNLRLGLTKLGRFGEYNFFATEEISDYQRNFEPIGWLETGRSLNSMRKTEDILSLGRSLEKRFFYDCLAHPNLYYLAAPELVWGPYLGALDIWQLHPFCDSRLITATHNEISWHLIHDWKSLYKQVLREAQAGILPESVRTRPKDDFGFDGFFLRLLRANQDNLLETGLKYSHLLGEHFNLKEFDATFQRNIFGVQNIQTQKLNRYLAYAQWAQGFERSYIDSPTLDFLPEPV